MRKSTFKTILLSFSYLYLGCNYKAGNRGPDLNYSMRITLNSFYVDKFLSQNYIVTDSIDVPLNSELKSYPERFFILIDSINNYNYVVESGISNDSINIQEWGLSLSSIYDNDKKKWIYSRDSLNPLVMKDFKSFFEEKVLLPTAEIYSKKVANDHLFSAGKSEAKILEIR
ncbi:hypothetical protein HGH93_29895 [Chitinophaga polysaccharea]|uniref:hypothetical protein n=1 Tax=Chitinophaga polysaccharea TaxID=1293035 RepID=UPI001455941A|nr:hypothetical protein [Chitinophaga polysaccharea]NLR62342.1 hypothetical protein [Chitinophaga polysaccharea]